MLRKLLFLCLPSHPTSARTVNFYCLTEMLGSLRNTSPMDAKMMMIMITTTTQLWVLQQHGKSTLTSHWSKAHTVTQEYRMETSANKRQILRGQVRQVRGEKTHYFPLYALPCQARFLPQELLVLCKAQVITATTTPLMFPSTPLNLKLWAKSRCQRLFSKMKVVAVEKEKKTLILLLFS